MIVLTIPFQYRDYNERFFKWYHDDMNMKPKRYRYNIMTTTSRFFTMISWLYSYHSLNDTFSTSDYNEWFFKWYHDDMNMKFKRHHYNIITITSRFLKNSLNNTFSTSSRYQYYKIDVISKWYCNFNIEMMLKRYR